ncbi:MAG: PD-(D/E)XK nuclease family protein [Nitrospiraceae bacterium]|nr:PD-(D/E)XK nuclease family protein [Nitrospiraceae bacterium]
MNALVIPFGPAGWREKRRILEETLSRRPGPPYLFNDLLILVPSSRMRRTYSRLILDLVEGKTGSHALAAPEILTAHQFLQQLASSLPGPRLIDENSRLVLLEGIVKERLTGVTGFGAAPDLLAPSLSAAVADMIQELSGAGVDPGRLRNAVSETDFSDRAQVRLLIEAYEAYLRILQEKELVDPAGLHRLLAEQFDPSRLAPFRTILIDVSHEVTALEARVLRKVIEHGDCTLLVEAPSAGHILRAGDYHPLRPVKEFLAMTGAFPVDGVSPADGPDRFIADALFSPRSFAEAAANPPAAVPEGREITLLTAVNIRDEVSSIAGKVKQSLLRGTPADEILVAFPSLDEYGPLAEEIFTDFGIPYNRALGRQLSASPAATAVLSLLRTCGEDFSAPSLLRVFSSPFLKFADQPALAPSLDRLLRERKIAGGRQKILNAARRHAPDDAQLGLLLGPLEDLAGALAPFENAGAIPLSLWMERLDALFAWSGLAGRVTRIKGPLNSNLQAYKKLTETLASLARAGRLFPEYRSTFSEWVFLLKKTFMHTRFQVPPDDEGGVQILGLEESAGRAFREVYLGGMVDGRFPQRLPQNIFLPETTLEPLGVRTLENARLNAAYHFYRFLLSAPRVTLTRPEAVGDKPVVASPFLAELAPLRLAKLLTEEQGGPPLAIEESRSLPELAKAIGLAGPVSGLDEVLGSDLPGIHSVRAALAFEPAEMLPAIAVPTLREFRVTALDAYLACPYDYYIRHVLGIEPLGELSEDISPLDRGTKVHAILRDFYRSWDRPLLAENREEAFDLLASLAERIFAYDADTFRNRREKAFFLSVTADRFLRSEIDFWKQGMRPLLLEQKIEGFPLTLSDGSTAELNAKIDRIDVDENGNFIIVDYKTGKYAEPRKGTDQFIFQLPVYAVMAGQTFASSTAAVPRGLRKPIGLAYYDLSGRMGPYARDVVFYDKDARNDHPARKPETSPRSAAEFSAILERSMDRARAAIEGILAGDFRPRPQQEGDCRNCANGVMCRREDRD